MKCIGTSILLLMLWASAAVASPLEHTLKSNLTGHATTIRVDLPASYELQDRHAYPVLYVLDGESNGEHARAVTDYLAEIGRAPEMIVVAVDAGPTRARDYLPATEAATAQGGGDAEAFLQFFADELVTLVEREYRAAPLRVISGHSYGGLFVLHAMAERPGLFAGGLAQSPYVDAQLSAPVLDAWESESFDPEGFVYACLGDEPSLQPGFERLGEALERADGAGFDFSTRSLEGESHMTTRLLGLYEGLQTLFGDQWSVGQTALSEYGPEALDQRIEELSEQYGYPILLAPSNYQRAVQLGFAGGDIVAAKAATEHYVDVYPRSVTAHFFAANVAAATGDRDAATAALAEAVRLYEADPRPEWSALMPQLQQLRSRLGGR